MKHRSVIAFVIVAAALVAVPQISHDLQAFRGALGARLRGEILQAFLSLPAAEGSVDAPAPRRARALVASCNELKAGAAAAKSKKGEAAGSPRVEARTGESAGGRFVVVADTAPEAWTELAEGADFIEAAGEARATVALTEVAMIIPPGSGVEPTAVARVSEQAARDGARHSRRLAEETPLAHLAARVEGREAEWRKVGESLRTHNESAPGGFEFRLERDGPKIKVLKVKRGPGACCPVAAPRAPRTAGHIAAGAPQPAPSASADADGE